MAVGYNSINIVCPGVHAFEQAFGFCTACTAGLDDDAEEV